MDASIETKVQLHENFWRGEGPSLILIPTAEMDPYDLEDYPERFHDPLAMWESEMDRAEQVIDWPTDGIPCIRPNLGVIFVPSMVGLPYRLPEGSMPWPGEPLSRDAIRAAQATTIPMSETMILAMEFYMTHLQSGRDDIMAYQADNQGIFDIAHLLYGEQLFYDLADPEAAPWLKELFQRCHEFYAVSTIQIKGILDEPLDGMIHGHGTPQGVYFPHTGTRCSEDTVTLISPEMIDRIVLTEMDRLAKTFGGLFVHFCGQHPSLLEQVCRMNIVHALDLGNPEFYDTRKVMEICAATGTVLHSRVASLPGETWQNYIRRIAALTRETGARLLLRPTLFPESREEAAEMQALWHEYT
jgi:hypothetical protein